MTFPAAEDAFIFNGIDATSGQYLLPKLSPSALANVARGQATDEAHARELKWRHHEVSDASFAPKEGVDPKRLAETGWGVIFTHGVDPAIPEALAELLEHRRGQASELSEGRYREFSGPDAYRPGESKQEFLARHGAGPGPVDPDVVPYYLLIVGDPTEIPYDFQYRLDVQYAVGRIHFDRVEDYETYARTVVACDRGDVMLQPRAAFFGTQNPNDKATALSASQLVAPLADSVARENDTWSVESFLGEAATKKQLLDLVGGPSTPAVLFTGTHGIGFPSGHPLQLRHQGGLVCQEWPGPGDLAVPISPDQYVSCDDLGDDARLLGLIAFHFACFGAGTPRTDGFSHAIPGQPPELAAQPFVGSFPKRALAHPRGGALAVVGHVDRAWGYSFSWPQVGRQTEVYRSCLTRLLHGHPLGSAFEYFNERYAELSTELSSVLEEIRFGRVPDDLGVAALWTANNDARGFAIVGDPAVRLPVHDGWSGDVLASRRVLAVDTRPRRQSTASTAASPTSPTSTGPAPPQSKTEAAPPDVDFGLLSGLKSAREQLGAAVSIAAEALGGALQRIVDELSVLEVATYVSEEPSVVEYDRDARHFMGADLKVLTRISLGGDASLLVTPTGEHDEPLWNMHVRMVEQARATRTELLGAAASAVGTLLDALKLL